MSFLKRTLLYLTRKKGKTLILFLLLFVVSTFVLSCFSLLYATDEVAVNMRTSVGAAFHIRSSVDLSSQGTSVSVEEQSVITEQAVRQIMENSNLKYYNGRNSGYAKGLRFMPGAYHSDENSMGQVLANNYSALHPHFVDGVLELTEGRHITEADKNVLLISETLAALNGLSIGDTVTLAPAELAQDGDVFYDALKDSELTADAQIIGIFKEMEPQANAAHQPTAGLRANTIFSDHAFLSALGTVNEGEYTGTVSFYVGDPLHLDDIVREAEKTNSIDWNKHFIRKDDWGYEKVSAGLGTIQNLISILLVCVSVVSAAVLILILAMRMRGRVHEAGILMSMGVPKRQVVGQFITEVAAITFIAFIFSYFVAGFISGRVESGILENLQVVQIDEQALMTGLPSKPSPSSLLTMPVRLSILAYTCLMSVITCSVLLTSLAIVKLKPREIFAKMS
jgi:ABC-type lipoprotein release transport system permease subunit